MTMLRLVLFMSGALLALADNPEVITVPEDVLKFIIGCRQAPIGGQYTVPVHKTDISDVDGTTSQHVSLLSLEELRESLSQTVHSEAVVGHILGQVEDAVKTDKLTKSRSNCLVDMQVNVPPQEIDDFNDRVQMLLQQNKILLLEQINTLFSYKLRNLKDDVERLVKRRSNQIMNKLDKIMAHLGIPEDVKGEDEEDDYDCFGNTSDDVTASTLDQQTTLQPSQPEPTPEPQPEPEVTPEPTTEEPDSAEPVSEPESEPEPEPESEPEPEPENSADVTDTTTLNPGSADSSKPTSSSSEEDTVEDNRNAGETSDTFIRTSQQKPIASNSGIGILPSLTRTRNRDRLRPSYPGGLTFQERYKQTLEQRRQFYRRN